MRKKVLLTLIVAFGAVLLTVSAFGAGRKQTLADTVVQGTTDRPTAYDSAGSYDVPSWNVIFSVSQELLTIAPGASTPSPQLAKSCSFSNKTTYTCVLKPGITFQNGQPLTAQDVKFSFDRVNKINDPAGPSSLISNLASVSVDSPLKATFHLKTADATWPSVLTTPAGAIVPSGTYPADKLEPDSTIIGTGPYRIIQYVPGEQTVLERWDGYKGPRPPTKRIIIRYYNTSSTLKLAVQQGEVDFAYRTLSSTDLKALRKNKSIHVVAGRGAGTMLMIFNLKIGAAKTHAVRQAVAYVINRQAIIKHVYNGTVQPAYSVYARGLAGHVDAFALVYGRGPNLAKARQLLKRAGISKRVPITIWYTPTHYGEESADMFGEISRQLQASGLFKVKLSSTEWSQYVKSAFSNQFQTFQLANIPDFPDGDNSLAPFYGSKSLSLNNGYKNATVDRLIAQERASINQKQRLRLFKQIQLRTAADVPLIPIYQLTPVAAARTGVTLPTKAFGTTFQIHYWLVTKR